MPHGETGLWPFLADADKEMSYHRPTIWDHLEQDSREVQTRSAEEAFNYVPDIDEDDEEN